MLLATMTEESLEGMIWLYLLVATFGLAIFGYIFRKHVWALAIFYLALAYVSLNLAGLFGDLLNRR